VEKRDLVWIHRNALKVDFYGWGHCPDVPFHDARNIFAGGVMVPEVVQEDGPPIGLEGFRRRL
jgi:hypothetical protein